MDVPFPGTQRCMIGHKTKAIDAGGGIYTILCGKRTVENYLWKTFRSQELSRIAF